MLRLAMRLIEFVAHKGSRITMLKILRIFSVNTPFEKELLAAVLEVYHLAFPYYPQYQKKIKSFIVNQHKLDFEVILLVAENQKGRLNGFCLAFYFPSIKFGYLDYIASTPSKAQRGVGAALYESLQ